MDTISSAEFRKTYAKLTETTIVTVNGHAIGVWNPSGSKGIAAVKDWEGPSQEWPPDSPTEPWGDTPAPKNWPGFNSRPFTPVPKTKGK